MNEELSPIERYKKAVNEKLTKIVDVEAPSGFVFKMKKPDVLGIVLGMGELPHYAASRAVEAWRERGVDTSSLSAKEVTDLLAAEKMLESLDRVMEFSHEPKIVAHSAQNEGEFYFKDLADEDIEYLMKWVNAGGDEALMASMFPQRPGKDTQLGVSGGKVGKTTKRVNRIK